MKVISKTTEYFCSGMCECYRIDGHHSTRCTENLNLEGFGKMKPGPHCELYRTKEYEVIYGEEK